MSMHDLYMRRCFDLARLGVQAASPNPVVGSVLVCDGRIIGEGFHKRHGGPHAEVNAIGSVSDADRKLLSRSTIYVSLEPCCHYGKTPPCTDLIIASSIPKVVIGTLDPNPVVRGNGIKRLQDNGVDVTTGVLEGEALALLGYFRSAMTRKRPYVIVKFVQSEDGYIGHPDYQVWLSNDYEKVMVHKLRSEVDAIMVGTNTAVIDNPRLNIREYFGKNPVRVAIDMKGRIPGAHAIKDGTVPTLVYTNAKGDDGKNLQYVREVYDGENLEALLHDLYERSIQSVLVEGGSQLISAFHANGLWDEAWVVTTHHRLSDGVRAPVLTGRLAREFTLDTDHIHVLHPH